MILKKFLGLFCVLILFNCSTFKENDNTKKINNCSNNVSIKYLKNNRKNDSKKVLVFFESDYNGVVKASSHDKIYINEKILTDESLGSTKKYIEYELSENNNLIINYNNDCVLIEIKKGYKYIYLYYDLGFWKVIYTNTLPTYE